MLAGALFDSESLLGPDDPPPFRLLQGRADSPFVLTADHAGRLIPRALGTLGLTARELETHVAWDIGIAGVSERVAELLGAFLILQTYSRLVIDCNRPLDAPSSIATLSEHTPIPGNCELSAEARALRARAVFEPYHACIEAELERRARQAQPTVLIAMHSFTPRFKGVDRPWQVGVLYHRDARLARRLLPLLAAEGLEVGDNQPYFVSDQTDYGIPRYGEGRGLVHVELELRQDLIGTEHQRAAWADRLARVFREAALPLLSS